MCPFPEGPGVLYWSFKPRVLFCFVARFVFTFGRVCFPLKKKKIFFVFLTQLSAQLPEVKAAVG